MKLYQAPWKTGCLILYCISILFSCRKPKNGDSGGGQGNDILTVSDRLQFFYATKQTGPFPSAPADSRIKISVKDTLYLMDEVKHTIKFMHSDTTKNVAGAYIQAYMTLSGVPVSTAYYYDVPESPEMANDGLVSVIVVGFDPKDIPRPLTFMIKIIPYDKNKQPLGLAERPVKVVPNTIASGGNAGLGGIETLADEYWDWEESYKPAITGQLSVSHYFEFWSEPEKYFLPEGQWIKGSCCAGYSIYGPCPGQSKPNDSLHFNTFYRISSETFTFSNGSFTRKTWEEAPAPLPAESDFCAGGEGKVRYDTAYNKYDGTYTISKVTPPAGISPNDTLALVATQVTSTGGGFGNSGGILHELNSNYLCMIKVDAEGFGQHQYKFYRRRKQGDPIWWGLGK